MLKQRILTAAVLIPVIILAIMLLPVQTFAVISSLVFMLAALEWGKLVWRTSWIGPWGMVVAFASLVYFLNFSRVHWIVLLLACLWWLCSLALLTRYPKVAINNFRLNALFQSIVGLLAFLSTWIALLVLRIQENGAAMVLLFIAVVVLADSAAYFVGRRWGVDKLAPQLSPGKTRQGLSGACVTVAVFALGVAVFWHLSLARTVLLLIGFVITALFSVIGDLYESMLKRQAGVKDSGALLPGHGGMLDRVDGLIAAAPFYVVTITVFRIFG